MSTRFLMRFPELQEDQVEQTKELLGRLTGMNDAQLQKIMDTKSPLSFKSADKAINIKQKLTAVGIACSLTKKEQSNAQEGDKAQSHKAQEGEKLLIELKEVLSSQNDFISERITELYEEIQTIHQKVDSLIGNEGSTQVEAEIDELNEFEEMEDDFSEFELEVESSPSFLNKYSSFITAGLAIVALILVAVTYVFFDELSQYNLF